MQCSVRANAIPQCEFNIPWYANIEVDNFIYMVIVLKLLNCIQDHFLVYKKFLQYLFVKLGRGRQRKI